MYKLVKYDYILVHLIWSDGKQVQGSQDYDIFCNVMNDGINIYPLFPMLSIAKRRMCSHVKYDWNHVKWLPKLEMGASVRKEHFFTDFCKSRDLTQKFTQNIWNARTEIIQKDIFGPKVTKKNLEELDQMDSNALVQAIMTLAQQIEK